MTDNVMSRSFFLNLLLSVLVLSGLSASLSYAQAQPESERTVIALFGDSLTLGENLNQQSSRVPPNGTTMHQGCPTLYLTGILLNQPARSANVKCPTVNLQAPIYNGNREKRNAIIANWGVGGTSTERGIRRIASELATTKTDVAGNQYIVLILYGTNDLAFGISSATTRTNTETMINIARSSSLGYTPIIGLLTPRDDRTGTGPSSIRAYNAQIQAAAIARGAEVVNHFAPFVNYPGGFTQLVDRENFGGTIIGLHPNDQGYMVIAENWFENALKNKIPVVQQGITMAPIISLLLDD